MDSSIEESYWEDIVNAFPILSKNEVSVIQMQ